MSQVHADLRAYYEEESRQGLRRGPLRGGRVEFRTGCLGLLIAENRSTVVDFGAGPGRDAPAFLDAGISYIGVDVARGNGVLAAEDGITVVQGSIAAPPLRSESFDAGWSMSTLMHIPEPEVPDVLSAMARVLKPGAPLFVGQWGGDLGEHIDDTELAGQQRLFSLRTVERNRELLELVGTIEREEVWSVGPAGWEYHVFVARRRSA